MLSILVCISGGTHPGPSAPMSPATARAMVLSHSFTDYPLRLQGSAGFSSSSAHRDGFSIYILADEIQGGVVADDVFIIIALPDIVNRCVLPHPFGYADFKTADYGTDRF